MKRKAKILSWIAGSIVVIIVLLLAANIYLESKIKGAIEENLKSQKISYSEVSVSVLDKNSFVGKPHYKTSGFLFEAEKISLKNLDYSQYIFHKKIVIENLEILSPKISLYKNDSVQKPQDSTSSSFGKNILFKEVNLKKGLFKIIRNDSVKLYFDFPLIKFGQVGLSKKTFGNKIPFNYKSLHINADSLFYEINSRHYISVSNLNFKNSEAAVKNLKLLSYYNKIDFQKHISVEHDRYQLLVPEITLKNFTWGYVNDSLQLSSPSTLITGANLDVYRNKLLPDDNTIKPLYSKMLRDAKVKLKFDSIQVKNSKIVYEEKEVENRKAGRVVFANVNAVLQHVQNVNLNGRDFPKTTVHAEAQFMNKSPLSLNLEFEVPDKQDKFHASGDLGNLMADQMNSFLTPFKNIKAEGEIESLYYNFYGDAENASGDMNLKYKDFRIKILQKGSNKKNSFLTGIANLLIKNRAQNKQIENRDITAQRDKTRSFWNYIWTCIRNGALKSFIKF